MLSLIGAAPLARVDVAVDGLRSGKGELLVCLTSQPAKFPECQGDPQARRLTVPVGNGRLSFAGVPSGAYALALIHDENGNRRLDTFVKIPREGIGFSRNPRLSFGPPPFAAAAFPVASDAELLHVRVKYFL